MQCLVTTQMEEKGETSSLIASQTNQVGRFRYRSLIVAKRFEYNAKRYLDARAKFGLRKIRMEMRNRI